MTRSRSLGQVMIRNSATSTGETARLNVSSSRDMRARSSPGRPVSLNAIGRTKLRGIQPELRETALRNGDDRRQTRTRKVRPEYLLRFAAQHQVALVEPDGTAAQLTDPIRIMRNHDHRPARIPELAQPLHALLLEIGIAD